MKKLTTKLLSIALIAVTFGTSCKKKEEASSNDCENSNNTEVTGCMDANAYNYNSEATITSNNCTFIKTTMYEITNHAEFNENGDDWDSFINTKADIIFRIKEEGASDWMFEGDVKNNQTHSDPAQWTAPSAEVLKNKNYEWELVDDETIGSDEPMANGTFNPKSLTNSNNEIITTYTDPNGLVTQLKIYYFIQ